MVRPARPDVLLVDDEPSITELLHFLGVATKYRSLLNPAEWESTQDLQQLARLVLGEPR